MALIDKVKKALGAEERPEAEKPVEPPAERGEKRVLTDEERERVIEDAR